MDVHEYIDEGMMELAQRDNFDMANADNTFRLTFEYINSSLGANAFKKWNGNKFVQRFLISAYEAVTYGISTNLDSYRAMNDKDRKEKIEHKVKELWDNPDYAKNSGAGVRGTTRLKNLLPFAADYFKI
jgi:hypothetical protein